MTFAYTTKNLKNKSNKTTQTLSQHSISVILFLLIFNKSRESVSMVILQITKKATGRRAASLTFIYQLESKTNKGITANKANKGLTSARKKILLLCPIKTFKLTKTEEFDCSAKSKQTNVG